jgi:hypothetical protein
MSTDIGTQITSISRTNDLVENVKKWVLCDKQLKLAKEKIDKIRDLKQELGVSILSYMETHPVSNNEIVITDGKIKLYEKKEYSPLTFSYIEQCLAKIIPEKSHVDFIIQYIKDNREVKTTPDLRSIYK